MGRVQTFLQFWFGFGALVHIAARDVIARLRPSGQLLECRASAFLVSAESWRFPFIELGFGTAGLGAVLNECGLLNGLGVPPCWRAYFFLLRQEKVAKKKATPRSAPLRGSLRYSAHRAACQNSPAAQTRQVDVPRSACVAQRLSRGPKSVHTQPMSA